MRIQEAAKALEISPRALRHYEATGLLSPSRDENGYRTYSAADLRRAERIRDMIATGYSTREILAIAPCLDDANAGPCDAAAMGLEHKLEQIDRLLGDLAKKREAVVERLASLKASLADSNKAGSLQNESHSPSVSFPCRVPGRRGRVSSRTNSDAHRR